MGICSDEPAVHAKLPLVILVNERLLTTAQEARVRTFIMERPNCVLLRRKSSWVNTQQMCELLKIIASRIEEELSACHILLLMDCCPSHMTPRVLQSAAAFGFWVHFLPASMTADMQPLDVYAFAILKAEFRKNLEELELQLPAAGPAYDQIVQVIFKSAITALLERPWNRAFAGCGFDGQQQRLGKRLLRCLEWESSPLLIGAALPALRDLQAVWPAHKTVPIAWLFTLPCRAASARRDEAGALRPAAMIGSSAAGPVTPWEADERAAGPRPWFGRLRSSSNLPKPANAEESESRSGRGTGPAPPAAMGAAVETPAEVCWIPMATFQPVRRRRLMPASFAPAHGDMTR